MWAGRKKNCKLEDRTTEITKFEEQKQKTNEKWTRQKDLWDTIKQTHIHIVVVPKKEKISEEIMVENPQSQWTKSTVTSKKLIRLQVGWTEL
jgi:hypothetical protein